MSTIAPTWTDNVVVQAPYALIKGAAGTLQKSIRSITGLDLRAKIGGTLFVAVGTGGSTAIVDGPRVVVRRMLANDAAAHVYSAPFWAVTTRLTAGLCLINGAVAAGVQSFAVDGPIGATRAIGDLLFFWGIDSGTGIPAASGAITPNHGCEVLRCNGTSATLILTDSVCKYDHHDNEYIGLADSFNIWLPGGSLYELVFDYSPASAGEAIAVMADIQTYDTDTLT